MRAHVLSGLDRLETVDGQLKGRRIGLMTNPTGVDHQLRSGIDRLHAEYNLTALFACEHGVRGNIQAGEKLETYVDEDTGVTVYSCYGDTKRLTADMLDAFDVFVFDMQDVGARFYTYLYSLSYAMEACAGAGKPVIVLDRINPLGGEVVQGTLLDEQFASFVGAYAMPSRYGLTIGEYALWVKDYLGLELALTIVPLSGWERWMYLDDTDVPWVAPSPNIPSLQAALAFTGTCIVEGTNLSEGRGTTQPFELVGAPWIDARSLEARMNAFAFPGIRFRRAAFTPQFSKQAKLQCNGIQMHIMDRHIANPFVAGLHLLETINAMHPEEMSMINHTNTAQMHLDLLLGSDAFGTGRLTADEVVAQNMPLVADFQERTRQYRLYK